MVISRLIPGMVSYKNRGRMNTTKKPGDNLMEHKSKGGSVI